MTDTFGSTYAGIYDALYQDKDYGQECDVVEDVFATYGERPVRTILDLGCGTGGHAVPLAQRGYEVVGVDRSEAMLAQARQRAVPVAGVAFQAGDLRELDLGRRFDSVLMMFAVLGYQLGNRDVLAALATARRHLQDGGLLVFDVWYGPAVLVERPSQRVKLLRVPDGQVLRVASGSLDARYHACQVEYHVWRMEQQRVVAETRERHTMRFFFPLEIELLLEQTGLELVRLGAFPRLDREPDESTWNVCVVARPSRR